MPAKSPPWTRDEIILALDLYHRVGRRVPDADDLPVIQVSRCLNRLPIHPPSVRAPNFRNPSGVVLKIANLRAFDKSTSSVGMRGGSKLDREIYEEFEDDPVGVARAARDVLQRYRVVNEVDNNRIDRRAAEDPSPYRVGFDALSVHMALEQDMQARAARRNQAPSLSCEVCGFDFERMYGDRGQGYIQYHHRSPLVELDDQRRPRSDELSLICANCHAMLHRDDATLTVAELKEIVREAQRASIRNLTARLTNPES